MKRDKNFNLQYIEVELDKISAFLNGPISIYVAGGCAMAYYNLKEATKDIDVVIETADESEKLTEALLKGGYFKIEIDGIEKSYRDMRTQAMVENADGFRWDIFVGKVGNRLSLTKTMKERANMVYQKGKISLSALSREDLFLMKAITDRILDLGDMSVIAKSGLDYAVILQECSSQSRKDGNVWTGYLYDKCLELKERYGIAVPILSELKRRAIKEEVDWARNKMSKEHQRDER